MQYCIMKGREVIWRCGESWPTTWRVVSVRFKNGMQPKMSRCRLRLDVALTTLSATDDWSDTRQFKELTKSHTGLGEIRFKLEGPPIRRFRPVGIWPPIVEREFILLLGCEKNRNIYVPPDAFTLALEYKRRWDRGEGEIHDYV